MIKQWESSTHAKIDFLGQTTNLDSHCNIHVLNNVELLIVPHSGIDTKSLWKFNLRDRKFIKWIDYPSNSRLCYSSSCLNLNRTKLYIFGQDGYIYTLDIKSGQFTKSQIPYHDGSHSQSIVSNGTFMIFGGYREENKSHFIWEDDQQNLRKVRHFHEMTDIDSLMRFAIAHIKSKDIIYFMDYFTSNTIYCYDLNTKQCIKTGIDRKDYRIYRAVVTLNEKYILGFEDDKIRIIDLETNEFLPNNVPFYHDHRKPRFYKYSNISDCCIKYDWSWMENVVIGYIRRNSIDIPQDIATLISQLFARERVFVLSYGQLWSADVDEIIAIGKGEKTLKLSECLIKTEYFY